MKRKSLDMSINNYKDIMSYLDKYNYDNSKNSSHNIKMLSVELTAIFQNNPSIKRIILGSRYDNNYEDENRGLVSWKAQAVYEALKTNSSIQYLELNFCIKNTDSAAVLGELLKVNTSLLSLDIQEYADTATVESAVLIADGIKLNRGLKSFTIYYESAEGGQKLITALQDNQSIIHFVNAWTIPADHFHELLLNNKNLTQIRLRAPELKEFVDEEHGGNINQLSDAIKIHPNLRDFMFEDDDYRLRDPLNQGMTDYDRDMYNFLKTILTGSRTLEMVTNAYVEGDFFSETELSQLMRSKKLINDRYIKALETLNESNLTIAQKSGIVAYFEKIGKNFIKEELKYVDWDNADLIKEYAEIYDMEELKQYDTTRGLAGFTEEQKNIWQAVFKQHVVVFDDKQEVSALRIINAAEQYRNDNFFSLKAITKDICKIGLVPELWSKIASYCESPPCQTSSLEPSIELVGDEVSIEVV